MKIFPINIPQFTHINTQQTAHMSYQTKPYPADIVTFSGKSLPKEEPYFLTHSNYWSSEDIKKIEGLQRDLKTFQQMTMPQAAVLINGIEHKDFIFPIVRGCHHNCSYCYLAAQAPIIRLSYEDFENTLNDIEKLTTRIGYKFANYLPNNVTLFYDSDGSELYLKDRHGDLHEFPELNKMQYDLTHKSGMFDTAGWNPKSKETQARMERLVKYYSDPQNLQEIEQINVSINPFEAIYSQAIKQKRKGNIKTYEYLKNKYIDMATNTLHTFAPLLKYTKYNILCRAYPNHITNPEYEGFKVKDMEQLRDEIFSAYEQKYAQELEEKPHILQVYKAIFEISSFIGASARNNSFKDYYKENNIDIKKTYSDSLNKEEYSKLAAKKDCMLLDLDGKIYLGNDNELLPTDIKLNFENNATKELPSVPTKRLAEFKTFDIELY